MRSSSCRLLWGSPNSGWMVLSKKGLVKVFDGKNAPRPLPGEPPKMLGHQEDFVDAIRNGRPPTAEIGIGHVSATLCHLGNIATRIGRSVRFDPATERIVGDDEAASLARRSYREDHWAVPKES